MISLAHISIVNILVASALFYVSVIKLDNARNAVTSRMLAPVAILSASMIALHTISSVGQQHYTHPNAIGVVAASVDMLTMLALIRIIKHI